MGLSKTGSNCFETANVAGYRRLPVPPASIMPFIPVPSARASRSAAPTWLISAAYVLGILIDASVQLPHGDVPKRHGLRASVEARGILVERGAIALLKHPRSQRP